jgi:hypothetical protein
MRQIESFFWGIVTALGALVIEIIFFITLSFYTDKASALSFSEIFLLPQFIIIATLIEEIFKYIILSKRTDAFSLEKTYLVNSFFVGLGFSSVEIIFIALSGTLPAWQFLAEITILHIGTSGLIGYFIAIRSRKKITVAIFAILIAVFFHAVYNLLTLNRDVFQNYAILILLGTLILINLSNFLRISHKFAQE